MAFLRTSLLPGLINASDFNIKNGTNNLRLYELSNVHEQKKKGFTGISETLNLAGVVCGQEISQSVHHKGIPQDLYTLKGYVLGLLNEKLKLDAVLREGNHPSFDLCHQIIVNGEKIGAFGRISVNLITQMDLDLVNTYGFELNMNLLTSKVQHYREYVHVNLFP